MRCFGTTKSICEVVNADQENQIESNGIHTVTSENTLPLKCTD